MDCDACRFAQLVDTTSLFGFDTLLGRPSPLCSLHTACEGTPNWASVHPSIKRTNSSIKELRSHGSAKNPSSSAAASRSPGDTPCTCDGCCSRPDYSRTTLWSWCCTRTSDGWNPPPPSTPTAWTPGEAPCLRTTAAPTSDKGGRSKRWGTPPSVALAFPGLSIRTRPTHYGSQA